MIIFPVSVGSTQSSRPLGSIFASQLPYSISFSRYEVLLYSVKNNFCLDPLGTVRYLTSTVPVLLVRIFA
jgi:hypothetical protein